MNCDTPLKNIYNFKVSHPNKFITLTDGEIQTLQQLAQKVKKKNQAVKMSSAPLRIYKV